jgi:hypothetical protein
MFPHATCDTQPPPLHDILCGLPEVELILLAGVARLHMRRSHHGQGQGRPSASSSSSSSSSSAAGGGGSGGGGGKEKAAPLITVGEAVDEFSRLSGALRKGVISEEQLVQRAFLNLARTGLIDLSNGSSADVPPCVVTRHTAVVFVPSEADFDAAFRKGFLADHMGSVVMQQRAEGRTSASSSSSSSDGVGGDGFGRFYAAYGLDNPSSRLALQVPNRVRRAVLQPMDPLPMEGGALGLDVVVGL